jgi:hypothetical protein
MAQMAIPTMNVPLLVDQGAGDSVWWLPRQCGWLVANDEIQCKEGVIETLPERHVIFTAFFVLPKKWQLACYRL